MAKTTYEGKRYNAGKLRMDLIPPEADLAIARVLTQGSTKYGDRNWEKGMAVSTVLASLKRHLLAYEMGEDLDDESGEPHLSHVLTNAAFLVTYFERGMVETDDRSSTGVYNPVVKCVTKSEESK